MDSSVFIVIFIVLSFELAIGGWSYISYFLLKLVLVEVKHDTFFASNGNSEKSEPQMGFEPATPRDLVGCSNHWAAVDSMASKGEMWVFV